MFKNAASGEQMLSRTGNDSTKPSAKGYDPLGGGSDPVAELTPYEKRQSLVAHLLRLQEEMQTLYGYKKKAKGAEIQAIQKLLREGSAPFKSQRPFEIQHLFMQAARERLPNAQFKLLLTVANDEQRKNLGNPELNPVLLDRQSVAKPSAEFMSREKVLAAGYKIDDGHYPPIGYTDDFSLPDVFTFTPLEDRLLGLTPVSIHALSLLGARDPGAAAALAAYAKIAKELTP